MGVWPRFTHSWGSRPHFQAETDKTQVLRPLVSIFHHNKALHHAYSPTYWCFILKSSHPLYLFNPIQRQGSLSLCGHSDPWPFLSSLHSAHQDLTVSTISPRKESPTSTAPGLRRELQYCLSASAFPPKCLAQSITQHIFNSNFHVQSNFLLTFIYQNQPKRLITSLAICHWQLSQATRHLWSPVCGWVAIK